MENIKLGQFLSQGSIIRTKHCDNPNWVTNVVYSISDDWIEMDIGLEKDYIDGLIMVGDTIKCKYATEESEITILGWVNRIRLEHPQSITLKVHSLSKFDNKRESYRFDVYLCSVIKPVAKSGKGIFAIMTNISRTGAAFVVNEDMEEHIKEKDSNGDIVCNFEIFLTPSKQLNFQGLLKRKGSVEKGIEYGVRIVDVDAKNEKKLAEFLEELEKKDKEFYNKRSSFWSKHSKYKK